MTTSVTLKTTLLAATAALLLSACGKNDNQTVGEKLDATVAKVEQKAEEAKASTEAATDKATTSISNTAETVSNSVKDAAITASVNAELAKDPALSALKINVDTANGRVLLKGTAPSTEARERATRLASVVDGVTSVDNQLEVRS